MAREEKLVEALTTIICARDSIADGEVSPVPETQSFDDWAADLAEKALDESLEITIPYSPRGAVTRTKISDDTTALLDEVTGNVGLAVYVMEGHYQVVGVTVWGSFSTPTQAPRDLEECEATLIRMRRP